MNEATSPITLPTAMSGENDTLTVKAVGKYGVSFTYGSNPSVIAQGADLLRVRAILDAQIANWRQA